LREDFPELAFGSFASRVQLLIELFGVITGVIKQKAGWSRRVDGRIGGVRSSAWATEACVADNIAIASCGWAASVLTAGNWVADDWRLFGEALLWGVGHSNSNAEENQWLFNTCVPLERIILIGVFFCQHVCVERVGCFVIFAFREKFFCLVK
jgi:hypothetical protein